MHKILPIFISSVYGVSFVLLIGALPAITQQVKTTVTMGAIIHLDPNDAPRAGQASSAWFKLTQRGGTVISADDCNCQLTIYSQVTKQPITDHLPLMIAAADPQAIGTTLTFPNVGAYTLVLSGQSKDDRFDPFELEFPVTVGP